MTYWFGMSAKPTKAPVPAGPAQFARTLRVLHDLSQRELAERAGLDEQTIYALERHGRVRRTSRVKIAGVFGIDPDYLEPPA